jgi:hypothetical protein
MPASLRLSVTRRPEPRAGDHPAGAVDDRGPPLPNWCAGHSLALLCAFLAIPALGSAYVLQLATDILTFTVLACSWNLTSGFTGYLSFGQVSFFGLGVHITALLVLHTPIPWHLAAIAAGVFVGSLPGAWRRDVAAAGHSVCIGDGRAGADPRSGCLRPALCRCLGRPHSAFAYLPLRAAWSRGTAAPSIRQAHLTRLSIFRPRCSCCSAVSAPSGVPSSGP